MTEEYHELNKALLPRFTNKLNHTTEPEMNKNQLFKIVLSIYQQSMIGMCGFNAHGGVPQGSAMGPILLF